MKTQYLRLLLPLALLLIFSFNSKAQLAVTSESYDETASQSASFIDVSVRNIYKVSEIKVNADIDKQLANVTVSQKIENVTGREIEVEILFPLPERSAIQNFILMVDGKEVPGKLLDRKEARSIYEGIVRRKKDPALMEYAGYGLYRTSVFPVPAGGSRSISLQYTMLLEQKQGNVQFVYPFGTQKFSAQLIDKVELSVNISSDHQIKNLFSPSHNITKDDSDKKNVSVSYTARNVVMDQDFKLLFQPNDDDFSVTMVSYTPEDQENGYFMMLTSPGIVVDEGTDASKNVILVIDKSGSMSGDGKIDQARHAAKFVINNLNDGDYFNIIIYENIVSQFSTEMVQYSKDEKAKALKFIENIDANGGTNIYDALTAANELTFKTDRPQYILFLTDGLPTVGNTNETAIAEQCKKTNKHGARIFPFGVGYDVNARLLDRISKDNGGMPTYVKPGANLEVALSNFYKSIQTPVLTDIEVEFDYDGVSEIYPHTIPDLFEGGQIELVGKYINSGKAVITVTGMSFGEKVSFKYNVEFLGKGNGKEYAYVETIWATRKIGFLIDQIDMNGETEELMTSLIDLSKKYGIMTPYTSFLAREDIQLNNMTFNMTVVEEEVQELNYTTGEVGVTQRYNKQNMMKSKSASYDSNQDGYADYVNNEGEVVDVKTMRNVGGRAFYYKDDVWVDGTLTDEQQTNATEVKQFSDEYFELSRNNSVDLNQFLTFDEDVIINLNGTAYKIVQ